MKRFNIIQINDDDSIQVVQQSKSKIQVIDLNITQIHDIPEEILATGTPGIYILMGNEDSDPYVGESTDVIRRISDGHMKDSSKRDWIERAMFITSTDISNPFNKAQIQWIERELIRLFSESGIVTNNKNTGFKHNLSYMDTLELEDDIEDIKSALKLLGLDLNVVGIETETKIETKNEINEIFIKNKYIDAKGIYKNGSVIVKEGSKASLDKHNKEHNYSQGVIKKLEKSGAISIKGNELIFKKSINFKNPSRAAVVFRGNVTNGWFTWKLSENGKFLDEIRKKEIFDIPDVPYETIVLKINDIPDIEHHLSHWKVSEVRASKGEVLAFARIVNNKRMITEAFKIKGYKVFPEHNNRVGFEIYEMNEELMKQYKGIDVSYNKGSNPCFYISKSK